MKKTFLIVCALLTIPGFAGISMIHSFNGGLIAPNIWSRTDFEKYYSSCRELENMLAEPWGDVTKRPGTYYIATEPLDNIEESTTTYSSSLTYFGEDAIIWGIQIIDGEMIGLDAGGVAVDRGSGLVGLPYTDHPFEIGDTVVVTGTTNYNGTFTLTSGTTEDEIQFADIYVSETFGGDELVLLKYTTYAGVGRCAVDSSENVYVSHNWYPGESTFISKIDTDGNITYDFLNHSWDGVSAPSSTATLFDIEVLDDYLYMMWDTQDMIEKYDLSTGDLAWSVDAGVGNGYDFDLDSSGNLYMKARQSFGHSNLITKFSTTDGSRLWTSDTTAGEYPYGIKVDEDNSFIVTTGLSSDLVDSGLYNIATWDLDGALIARTALNGTYFDITLYRTYNIACGFMDIYDGSIYVVQWDPTPTIYKLDSDLNILASVAGPSEAQGLYIDHSGNVIVVNVKWGDPGINDRFYTYDSDLNLLGYSDNLPGTMLAAWAPPIGNLYIQGQIIHTTIENITSEVIGTTTPYPEGTVYPVRLINFEHSQSTAYIIEMGQNYFRFYK